MRISVTIPGVQASQMVSNVLGVAGLIGLTVAVGALAGTWWWSLLTGSLITIALAWVANTHAQARAAEVGGEEAAQPLRVAPMSRAT